MAKQSLHDNIQNENTKVPKFGVFSGIGGIFVYSFISLPVIMITALIAVSNSSSTKDNALSQDFTNKINELVTSSNFLVVVMVVNCVGIFVYAILVSKIRGSKSIFNDLGIKFSPSSLYFVFLGIALQFIGLLLTSVISALNGDTSKRQEVANNLSSSNGLTMALLFILIVLFVPIAEELCFRGIFLRGLLRRVPPTVAVLISGIVFASIHLSDANAIYGYTSLLLVGIISGALTLYRGKIDASIALHVGFNLTAAIFLVLN